MTAYYNEIDEYKAAWIRNLIRAGEIAPGVVDTRSIEDVHPDELRQYTQCHFFAGVGIWSYALRKAGWPDDYPVWTGSCPCQPFSAAGKRAGVADERHLWPAFNHLIGERKPDVVFGEQVASPDGLAWLDTVWTDMEGQDYALGANDLCGAGFGAPHIRQRQFWVANRISSRLEGFPWDVDRAARWPSPPRSAAACSCSGGLADCACGRPEGGDLGCAYPRTIQSAPNGKQSGLADNGGKRQRVQRRSKKRSEPNGCGPVDSDGRSPVAGFWRAADWLHCRDAKWRPVEPGSFPMAHELAPDMGCDSTVETSPYREERPWRKGMIHGYGDGIIAEVAIEFISAFLDVHKQDRLSRLGN